MKGSNMAKQDINLARTFGIYDPFCAAYEINRFDRIRANRAVSRNSPLAGEGVKLEVFYGDETFEDYEQAVAASGERVC